MTDDAAEVLLNNYLSIEGDHVLLMKTYSPGLENALPGIKMSCYYQIENKTWAAFQYEPAKRIPLVQ